MSWENILQILIKSNYGWFSLKNYFSFFFLTLSQFVTNQNIVTQILLWIYI